MGKFVNQFPPSLVIDTPTSVDSVDVLCRAEERKGRLWRPDRGSPRHLRAVQGWSAVSDCGHRSRTGVPQLHPHNGKYFYALSLYWQRSLCWADQGDDAAFKIFPGVLCGLHHHILPLARWTMWGITHLSPPYYNLFQEWPRNSLFFLILLWQISGKHQLCWDVHESMQDPMPDVHPRFTRHGCLHVSQ